MVCAGAEEAAKFRWDLPGYSQLLHVSITRTCALVPLGHGHGAARAGLVLAGMRESTCGLDLPREHTNLLFSQAGRGGRRSRCGVSIPIVSSAVAAAASFGESMALQIHAACFKFASPRDTGPLSDWGSGATHGHRHTPGPCSASRPNLPNVQQPRGPGLVCVRGGQGAVRSPPSPPSPSPIRATIHAALCQCLKMSGR